ncbi:MAG: hypothetical protein PCFJNLEI_01158 [Verrucomicrobiae bacterium]|nr:hypothetical protein [Verrucomicrobiae bacterium]
MRITSLLLLALALAGCSREPRSCAVCQRAECKGLAFRVTLTTGKTVETCCPRCGLHYLETTQQQARSLQVTDLATGQWLDASQAVFVAGSEVSPCAPSKEAVRDTHGCCAVKGFDRCNPSLIAFASADSARAFQKQHGGELLTWQQMNPKPPTN